MGLAGLLIVLGVIIWLLLNPVIGLVLLLVGVIMAVWSGMSYRSGYAGQRRVWY